LARLGESRHYLDDIPLCPGAALHVIVGMSDIATHSIRQADLKITGTVASDTRNGNAKYKLVVVKPLNFIAEGPSESHPARHQVPGPEYLRIIYGPNACCPRTLNGGVLGTLERNAPSPAGNLPWESSLWNALSVRSRYDSGPWR
jgi:hypothetical protein